MQSKDYTAEAERLRRAPREMLPRIMQEIEQEAAVSQEEAERLYEIYLRRKKYGPKKF